MKIIILGDSISQGIGSQKKNYEIFLKENLAYEIKNLALTGTTIKFINDEKINEILKYNPDYIIIFYGNVDSMPRPNKNFKIDFLKFLPKRFSGNGMLNPRALYSNKNKIKRIFQKIDSFFRINLNKILIKVQGYEQWCPIEEYEEKYNYVLDKFEEKKIIVISPVPMYEKYFPYANEEVLKYVSVLKKIIKKRKNIEYLDLYNIFLNRDKKEIFLNDYFHPNLNGYEIIALEIEKKINY